jgi:hypothetical protein
MIVAQLRQLLAEYPDEMEIMISTFDGKMVFIFNPHSSVKNGKLIFAI